MTDTPPKDSDGRPAAEGLTFWSVLLSTLGAAFGVQSPEVRHRDFASGSFWPFVAAGILFTVAFVGGLIALVWVLVP